MPNPMSATRDTTIISPAMQRFARMNIELMNLKTNLSRLDAFIGTPAYEELPTVEKSDLCFQANAMRDYQTILQRRVDRALSVVEEGGDQSSDKADPNTPIEAKK